MKRITLSLGLIAVMVIGVQMSFNTTSFPGFHSGAQCGICHNEPTVAWNASYASESITLDGNIAEPFWAEANDNNMYVPAGTLRGFIDSYEDVNGTDIEVPFFITLRFAQNSTHLFVRAVIHDNTQTGSTSYNAADVDGFAMLWNIDQDEFMLPDAGNTLNDWMAMDGDNLNGGKQDLVFVSPSSSGQSAPSYNTTSMGFDNNTQITMSVWDKNYGGTTSESQDWAVGAWHGKENTRSSDGYYSIELARPLVTDDENDVQFQYDGYYEFAVASWNDSKGVNHAVSFEHTVWVHGADGAMPLDTVTSTVTGAPGATSTLTETTTKTETPFGYLASFFGIISIAFVTVVYRKKN